ncbi:MAG: class I SAM-dependent methyltransferase, partial [Chitinophagaceae bacterium]|nr:class I SAM-dependent methyltransferase [Chitinophagaceae bacterium]
AITMWHVLEHVHSLQEYITQLKKLLTANGRLIIAVPNYTSSDAASYGEYWDGYDVPRHLYHFSQKSIETLVVKHGLKLLACKPICFDSFYVSLLSSKYKNGKTNWIGAGFTGFISNFKAMMNVRKCSSVIYIISR